MQQFLGANLGAVAQASRLPAGMETVQSLLQERITQKVANPAIACVCDNPFVAGACKLRNCMRAQQPLCCRGLQTPQSHARATTLLLRRLANSAIACESDNPFVAEVCKSCNCMRKRQPFCCGGLQTLRLHVYTTILLLRRFANSAIACESDNTSPISEGCCRFEARLWARARARGAIALWRGYGARARGRQLCAEVWSTRVRNAAICRR